MQISNQTQSSSAAYGMSETLSAKSQFQLQALNGAADNLRPGSAQDQVSLSPGAVASSRGNNGNDPMASLLGMMESILQHILGTSLSTSAASMQPNASTPGSSDQTAPSTQMDQLTSSILSALQGNGADKAAQSGGSQNSLLSALNNMGNAVQNDALSLFNSLSAQNQSMMNGLVSSAAAQGASGSYQSLVAVSESETYHFSASGKLTTASGQTYQFSLDVELQASVSIASMQSGTFGPASAQSTGAATQGNGSQQLQLGQQAGAFAGGNLAFDWPTLLKGASGQPQDSTSDHNTPTLQTIGQQITSALANLKLSAPSTASQSTPQQQQVSALLHPKHGHHKQAHHGQTSDSGSDLSPAATPATGSGSSASALNTDNQANGLSG